MRGPCSEILLWNPGEFSFHREAIQRDSLKQRVAHALRLEAAMAFKQACSSNDLKEFAAHRNESRLLSYVAECVEKGPK